MTTLSGPVGIRNSVTQVQNAPVDQAKVIKLLWAVEPANAGQKDVSSPPSAGGFKRCNAALADAIAAFQAFWVLRGELRVADGVVDPGGGTLRKLDALAGGPRPGPPQPSNPSFTDLKVLRFLQTLPAAPASLSIPAVVPGSVMPYLFRPLPKHAALVEGNASATITELLIKIEKNGAIFWVGACVPQGTTDFSRAYIFFHPDTIAASDDAAYPSFTGRWPTVKRYVASQGLQLAAMKKMTLLVPFMTNASRANTAAKNLFADQGVDTLNDILTAVQISLGQSVAGGSVQQVGVASYSSGVNHLFRFAQVLGGTGIIREQIDFDSAFMVNAHKSAPVMLGTVNWMVTQSPPRGSPFGWLQLDGTAWRNVNSMRGDVHGQIGNLMFQAMMGLSVIL